MQILVRYKICIVCIVVFCSNLKAQKYTLADTLKGTITPERAWWDVNYYHLSVAVNLNDSTISGSNVIQFTVKDSSKRMQIDLQAPMQIRSIIKSGKPLSYQSVGNAHFITFDENLPINSSQQITVNFYGSPFVGDNPPWSGGIVWSTDSKGKPFVATACQSIGASVWWPCKDHPYDEPDSVKISVTVPKKLMNVSNGRLVSTQKNRKTKTYTWEVSNPINNYGVNLNIGNYTHIKHAFNGEKGLLNCNYYVLKQDKHKAKKYFKDQVTKMLTAFEHWFGPYPFYKDGYKLVQAPYVGMEHQSSVTYGNGFKYGYGDYRISNTKWDTLFDFIIIHESGHEWFANSITNTDVADMWIHEGFTSYSENLFVNYHFGKQASSEYVIGTRQRIRNTTPIITDYNVSNQPPSDMYFKGAQLPHYLRSLLNNDDKWRAILRKMNVQFYHKTISSAQLENFLIQETGYDLKNFFHQYLRTTQIPTLEYQKTETDFLYRWTNTIDSYNAPLRIFRNNESLLIHPTNSFKKLSLNKTDEIKFDPNFYIQLHQLAN